MASSTGKYVLLLNPDASIDSDSIARLVDALEADADLAGVGPRTIDDDGHLSFTQRRFPRLRSTYAQGLFLHRAAPLAAWSDDAIRDPGAYELPATPDWVSGCCVLLRRGAVEQVGGLDEGFFLFAEETDLFRRLTSAGWRVGYEPRAVARHEGNGSGSWYRTEGIRAYSRVRYARKHHGPVIAFCEAVGLALGAVTHAAIWIREPARALGHLRAARAALVAVRTVGGTV
jgi:GT2 family glycosyltransferase